MTSDWWRDAEIACQQLYGSKWDEMTFRQRNQAIKDFVRQCRDIAQAVKADAIGDPKGRA